MMHIHQHLAAVARKKSALTLMVERMSVAPHALWGYNVMSSDILGVAIHRQRRASDNAQSDFSIASVNSTAGDGTEANGSAQTVDTWASGAAYQVSRYDQSGNGYTLTQSTTGLQGLFQSTGINSKATVDFDATDDASGTANLWATTEDWTVVIGCKCDSLPGVVGYAFSCSGSGGLVYGSGSFGSSKMLWYHGGSAGILTSKNVDTNPHVFTVTRNSGNLTIRCDGAEILASTSETTSSNTTPVFSSFQLNNRPGFNFPLSGPSWSCGVWQSVLSSDDRAIAEEVMADYGGVTLA